MSLDIWIPSFVARFGNAEVQVFHTGSVKVNGTSVQLTDSEKKFLLLLAQGMGKVVTTRMLITALYKERRVPRPKLFDVLRCKIRSKLRLVADDAPDVLHTVWGRGYSFGTPAAEAIPTPRAFPTVQERWVPSRKAFVVQQVAQGHYAIEEVLGYYPDLSIDEFLEWKHSYDSFGSPGLRTTRVQRYPISAAA